MSNPSPLFFDPSQPDGLHPFERLLRERIVIIDGAMGTNVQARRLTEADFRGECFANHPSDLKGNNDLLSLTQPRVIEEIHEAFLRAGADLIETNTFNATSLSQAEYGLEAFAYELNVAAAGCARRAADRVTAEDPARPRFVAGAIGPLSKTLSISRDVNDPGARDVTFDQVRAAYADEVRGLLDGGVDVILIETIFRHPQRQGRHRGGARSFRRAPLSTRAPHDLGHNYRLVRPHPHRPRRWRRSSRPCRTRRFLSVGLNCALGPQEMRPHIEAMGRVAPIYVSAYPNAGLPDPLSPTGFPETPETLSAAVEGLGGGRPPEPGRRLLRDDARAHPRHRRGGARHPAAPASRLRAEASPERLGGAGGLRLAEGKTRRARRTTKGHER